MATRWPKMAQVGPKMGPRCPQDCQICPTQMAQDGLRWARDAPKIYPRGSLGRSKRGSQARQTVVARQLKNARSYSTLGWPSSDPRSNKLAQHTGDWSRVKKPRKQKPPNQGRLKDQHGQLVSCEDRSETLAKHLETVQWAVRPTSVAEARPSSDKLLVNIGPVSEDEIVLAATKIEERSRLWSRLCA